MGALAWRGAGVACSGGRGAGAARRAGQVVLAVRAAGSRGLLKVCGRALAIRALIDTDHAHIGQYDKCFTGILLIADICSITILVIGNMYRYIGKSAEPSLSTNKNATKEHFGTAIGVS